MKKQTRKKKRKTPRRRDSVGRGGLLAEAPLVGVLRRVAKHAQRYFVTGALVWVPLIVTCWVSWWVFKNIGLSFEAVIKRAVLAVRLLGERVSWLHFLAELRYIPGLGFLLVIALFFFTGYLARYLLAQKIIRSGELLVRRIPLISRIYTAVQQIRDVFVSRNGAIFQQVALVEYPRPGVHVVGFVTAQSRGVIRDVVGDNRTAVFIPTTPNPTSGFLLFFPNEEIKLLDMSVEDAMKLIISGGAYMPEKEDAGGDHATEIP